MSDIPTLQVGTLLTLPLAASILAHYRAEAEAELARAIAALTRRGTPPTHTEVWTPTRMVEYYGREPRAGDAATICLASLLYDGPNMVPKWCGMYLWLDQGIVSANEDL